MGQFITEGVPNDEVEQFCQDQKDLGATKCTPTDNNNGTSDVLVEYPDEK
jgi:hypothetical protein